MVNYKVVIGVLAICVALVLTTGCTTQESVVAKSTGETITEHAAVAEVSTEIVSSGYGSSQLEVRIKNIGSTGGAFKVYIRTEDREENVYYSTASFNYVGAGEKAVDKIYPTAFFNIQIVGVEIDTGHVNEKVYFTYKEPTPEPTKAAIQTSTNDKEFVVALNDYLNGKITALELTKAPRPDNGFLQQAREHAFQLDEDLHDFKEDGTLTGSAKQRAEQTRVIIVNELKGYRETLGI